MIITIKPSRDNWFVVRCTCGLQARRHDPDRTAAEHNYNDHNDEATIVDERTT